MYTHTHVHTHVHYYTYTYVHTHMYTHTCTHMYTYMSTHMCNVLAHTHPQVTKALPTVWLMPVPCSLMGDHVRSVLGSGTNLHPALRFKSTHTLPQCSSVSHVVPFVIGPSTSVDTQATSGVSHWGGKPSLQCNYYCRLESFKSSMVTKKTLMACFFCFQVLTNFWLFGTL